jgi:hypothetical protein
VVHPASGSSSFTQKIASVADAEHAAAREAAQDAGAGDLKRIGHVVIHGAELQVVTPSGSKRPHCVTLRDFLIESLGIRCRGHGT